MERLKLSPLLSEEKIQERVLELGKQISKDYSGQDLLAVCVLKGSIVFYSDLIRHIDTDLGCDYLGASSYLGGTSSSGEVKLTLDLSYSVKGRNLLLVEDIIDSGITINFLRNILEAREPKSIKTAALLSKPGAHKTDVTIDYVGFEIGNEFVVGYGLDYQGYYRNLPYIAQVGNIN
ncbi:MAG: hypoxanthine phosphoribosyltransferase [Bdellovibrionales bacterium]|nr:hypoxanthine phosphoribosyltransferase [Bdellovibrionales bacterium]